jgi:hypothetical protein
MITIKVDEKQLARVQALADGHGVEFLVEVVEEKHAKADKKDK